MTSTDELRATVTSRADSVFAAVDLDGLVTSAARRGRRRRRERVAGGLAVAAAAIAGAIVVVPPLLPRQDVAPVVTPAPKLGFPGATNGGLLMDAAAGEGTASVTVAAPDTALAFDVVCPTIPAGRDSSAPDVRLSIAGPAAASEEAAVFAEPCDAALKGVGGPYRSWDDVAFVRDSVGVEPGDAVTVTATVKGRAVPVRLAVYRLVPLDDYPLPSPPDPLRPLEQALVGPTARQPIEPLYAAVLPSGGTTSTAQVTLPTDPTLSVLVVSQTPADVTLRLDGAQVMRTTVYDYEQQPRVTQVRNPAPTGGTARLDVVVTGSSGAVQVMVARGSDVTYVTPRG